MGKSSYDDSRYFQGIIEIFNNLPDESGKRAYVTAIAKCLDLNSGSPVSPIEIATNHGFHRSKIHSYKFALTKSHAIDFFVKDINFPGLLPVEIRKIGKDDYTDRFSREPFTRGRSAYWYSVGEWISLLNVRGEINLPTPLHEYALSHDIKLPNT